MSKMNIVDAWYKFAADCTKDSGYKYGNEASLVKSELEERWEKECPGLETPTIEWSGAEGRYIVKGLSVSKINTTTSKDNKI